jgi:propanediol dehydratase small subunit
MSQRSESVTRRDFARLAAAAAAVPLVAASAEVVALAADDQKPEAAKPPHERPLHELYLDVLRNRFPHEKLTPENLELLRADIAGDLGRSRPLDKFPLKNSDEPGFVFAAWRQE